DALALREGDELVVRVDTDGDALGVARDARIAGRRDQRVDERALRDLPGQRVLATPAADKQDFHCSGCLRAGLHREWPEIDAAWLPTPDLSVCVVRPGFAASGSCAPDSSDAVIPLSVVAFLRLMARRGARRRRGGHGRCGPTGCRSRARDSAASA